MALRGGNPILVAAAQGHPSDSARTLGRKAEPRALRWVPGSRPPSSYPVLLTAPRRPTTAIEADWRRAVHPPIYTTDAGKAVFCVPLNLGRKFQGCGGGALAIDLWERRPPSGPFWWS
jgi:hypothetical protein